MLLVLFVLVRRAGTSRMATSLDHGSCFVGVSAAAAHVEGLLMACVGLVLSPRSSSCCLWGGVRTMSCTWRWAVYRLFVLEF